MRIAVYPGSFDPWHEGHEEVVRKALQSYDLVIILRAINPDKKESDNQVPLEARIRLGKRVRTMSTRGLLVNYIKRYNSNGQGEGTICAVIRGIRNAADFEAEKIQQYWNEDLGLPVPVFYVISGRDKCHISSSAIRAVKSFEK